MLWNSTRRHQHPILRQLIDTGRSSYPAHYLLEAAICTIKTDHSWHSDPTQTAALVERLRFHRPCKAHRHSHSQSEKIHMLRASLGECFPVSVAWVVQRRREVVRCRKGRMTRFLPGQISMNTSVFSE